MAPYADLPVMASLAASCLGSAHRPLALTALTLGDDDGAIDHLDDAIRIDLALGNLPCVAIDRALLARVLRRRGRPADAERAEMLLRSAIDMGRSFGMDGRVDQWLGEQTHPIGERALECRRHGRSWHVLAGDARAVVAHSVGMTYLAELIAHPGVEIPALELASAHQLTSRTASPQPLIDRAAKARYRRRVEELRADVADAEDCNDLARTAIAREALERYLEELSAATGLGGRDRRFADDAERARISVHKALKRALAAITRADPDVGHAIAARLVTGARCVLRSADERAPTR